MLVLTRKAGENIQIGDQITISIVRIKGQRAQLGIEAPRSVSIRRNELLFEATDPAKFCREIAERPHTPPK
jgi:carbon storage regulator